MHKAVKEMPDLFHFTFWGLLAGCFGTAAGAVISFLTDRRSNRVMSFVLEFSAGLMMALVCFDLLPESFAVGGLFTGLIGVGIGVILIIILEHRISFISNSQLESSMLSTAVMLLVGIALHNFPEGIAAGSAFDAEKHLGLSLLVIVAVHNIPEGFSVAVPLRAGGVSHFYILLGTFLAGIPAGIGVFAGGVLGTVSDEFIALSLGFAGGAMLYIICGELIPKSKGMYGGRFSSIGNILGILFGIILSRLS